MIGDVVGSYRIIARLGEGGMGVVYRAEHVLLGRPAAVKVLVPSLSRNPEIVNRFFNEARATAGLAHPGIVDVYDFGYCADGAAFLVMELLEGESLRSRLGAAGRIPWPTAVQYARQIAAALAAAHASRIVHRDLKPDNLFVTIDHETGQERIKILDFGIAKLGAEPTTGAFRTRAGVVLGTPTYMSPQQCRGANEVDHRADVYSLGCIVFEMICGRPPFVGDSLGDVIDAHLSLAPPAAGQLQAGLPPELEGTIARALAKLEDDRQPSMDTLIAELDRVVSPLTALARPRPTAADAPTLTGAPAITTGPGSVTDRAPWRARRTLRTAVALALIAVLTAIAIARPWPTNQAPPATEPEVAVASDPVPDPTPAPRAVTPRRPKLSVVQLTEPAPAPAPGAPAARAKATSSTGAVARTNDTPGLAMLLGALQRSTALRWIVRGLGDDFFVERLGRQVAIQVVSSPPAAAVTFDGTVIGTTPLTIAVDRGAYDFEVALALPGYVERKVALWATLDHTEQVSLVPLVRLRITSTPTGAEVIDDGLVVGTTPLEVQLPPSAEATRLRLRRAGFLEQTIDLVPTADGVRGFALVPEPRRVVHRIDSIPTGVDVLVGGEVVGTTPYRVELVDEGSAAREYVLRAPGHGRYRDTRFHARGDQDVDKVVPLRDACATRRPRPPSSGPALVDPYDSCPRR